MNIITYPNVILETKCDPVTTFGSELKLLVEQMAEVMYVSNGIGLAAPQIGVLKNIIIVDPSGGEISEQMIIMVNPIVIFALQSCSTVDEGCLSLPGISVPISRSLVINVDYVDIDGKQHSISCTDLLARIVQHETDHLQGITILDKIGSLGRKMALKNLVTNE